MASYLLAVASSHSDSHVLRLISLRDPCNPGGYKLEFLPDLPSVSIRIIAFVFGGKKGGWEFALGLFYPGA